jgi:hypothetical protein
VSGKRAVALVLVISVLLAGVLGVLFWSVWPAGHDQEAAAKKEIAPVRTRSGTDAMLEVLEKPPKDPNAFPRSAIMSGRLGVMRLADQDATLALLASNIPVVFECIDALETECT